MRLLRLWCFLVMACLLGAGATTARAEGLRVAPVLLEVQAPGAQTSLTLRNVGKQPITVQARVFAWDQGAGKDRLVPTRDVVVSPPITQVRPGAEQSIRIVRTTQVQGARTGILSRAGGRGAGPQPAAVRHGGFRPPGSAFRCSSPPPAAPRRRSPGRCAAAARAPISRRATAVSRTCGWSTCGSAGAAAGSMASRGSSAMCWAAPRCAGLWARSRAAAG